MSNSWILSLRKGDVLPSTPSAQGWGCERGDRACRSQVVRGGTQGVCGWRGSLLPWPGQCLMPSHCTTSPTLDNTHVPTTPVPTTPVLWTFFPGTPQSDHVKQIGNRSLFFLKKLAKSLGPLTPPQTAAR